MVVTSNRVCRFEPKLLEQQQNHVIRLESMVLLCLLFFQSKILTKKRIHNAPLLHAADNQKGVGTLHTI